MYSRQHDAGRASGVEPTLRRGMACLSCRRRKSKCGGERPSCRQCVRLGRAATCEYNSSRRARSESSAQALETDESNPQSPTLGTEQSPDTAMSVFLHDPHAAYHGSQVLYPTDTQNPGTDMHLFSSVPIPESQRRGSQNWWDLDEPPPMISEILIQHFIPHRHRLGFALDVDKLVAALRLPLGHPGRPHSALTNAVYLWGLLLTPADAQAPVGVTGDVREYASKVLNRAVLALSEWSGAIPQKRMHAVQAEVLIAQYFFFECRYLEGLVHISASVTMAIGCSLHKIRYPSGDPNETVSVTGEMRHWDPNSPFELPIPRDMGEMRERMDLFRTVLILDKCWSVAVRIAPCSENTRLDAAWTRSDVPIESTSASAVASSSAVRVESRGSMAANTASLVQQLRAAHYYGEAERLTSLALSRSHSPSVYAQIPSSNVAGASSPRVVPQSSIELFQEINNFIQTLRSVASQGASSSTSTAAQAVSPSQVTAETLAYGAIIRLFTPYMGNADAYARILRSALRVVVLVEASASQTLVPLDPTVMIVWRETAQVLARSARNSLDIGHEIDPNVSNGILRMVSALKVLRGDAILSQQSNSLMDFLQQTFTPQP